MPELWTGEMVGRMHVNRITFEELGDELGVTKNYVGMILNGHRKPAGIQKRMEDAVAAILDRRNGAEKPPAEADGR